MTSLERRCYLVDLPLPASRCTISELGTVISNARFRREGVTRPAAVSPNDFQFRAGLPPLAVRTWQNGRQALLTLDRRGENNHKLKHELGSVIFTADLQRDFPLRLKSPPGTHAGQSSLFEITACLCLYHRGATARLIDAKKW